jgi:hypothetical protein
VSGEKIQVCESAEQRPITRFVKITLANKKFVWLNPDTVSAVFQHDDGKVSVYGVGDTDAWTVAHTLPEVLEILTGTSAD